MRFSSYDTNFYVYNTVSSQEKNRTNREYEKVSRGKNTGLTSMKNWTVFAREKKVGKDCESAFKVQLIFLKIKIVH